MTLYEQLLEEAYNEGIIVKEVSLNSNADGLYMNNKIAINKNLNTVTDKACVLAEELGHHYTTIGNILDLKNINNAKQELQARKIAYNKLLPLDSLAETFFKNDVQNIYELSELLDLSVPFLKEALEYYTSKYGTHVFANDFLIVFEPSLYVYRVDEFNTKQY